MAPKAPSDDGRIDPLAETGEQSPDQSSQIDLEIIEHEFDQDKSDSVTHQAPLQINFGEDGYTTVERSRANNEKGPIKEFKTRSQNCTLYNPDGKVETTLPLEYLSNIKEYGFTVPTVANDSTGEYLLVPSNLKASIKLISGNSNPSKDSAIVFGSGSTGPLKAVAIVTEFFIRNNGGISQYNGWEDGCTVNVGNFNSAWNRLIQEGKIRFADEEKVKHFVIKENPPMEMATETIKNAMKNATVTTKFDNKKMLLVTEGRLKLLDWESDIAANWSLTEFALPEPEDTRIITGGGVDPKENFLLAASGNILYIIDPHSKPIKIVKKFESPEIELHGALHLKDNGTIIAGDRNGRLIAISSNLNTFINRRERLEQERSIQKLRNKKKTLERTAKASTGPLHPELEQIASEIHVEFIDLIMNADSLNQLDDIKKEILARKSEYQSALKDSKLVDTMFATILEALKEKETTLLAAQVDDEMQSVRTLLGRIDGMSLPDLADARRRVDTLKGSVLASNLDSAIKTEIAAMSDTFAERATEAIGNDEEKLIAQIDGHLKTAKDRLDGITKLSEFEVWQNTDYLAFLDALSAQMRIIPASHQKVIDKIRDVEVQVREMKRAAAKKFAEKYEDVRAKASSQTNIMEGLAVDRVEEFVESFKLEVQKKHFRNAEDAREWVERNPLYTSTLAVIEDLSSRDPEKADVLRQKLKIEVAQLAYEVKQMQSSSIDEETGRQMVTFGKIAFPIWEENVVEKKRSGSIELTYKIDNSSKGPGVKTDDYMCELFYKVTDENGKVEEIPMNKDDRKKYGRFDERFSDEAYFESHLPLGRARKMLSSIKAMESERAQGVKAKYEEFQTKMKELNKRIAKLKETAAHPGSWSTVERDALTKEYVSFLQESGIYGWYALKAFKKSYKAPETKTDSAGQGRVPDKASYWVEDEDTKMYLDQFAEMAKLSMALQDGLISLEGHAGTGKDVLVQMFANKTKRPLYSFDCSKWTTEFDLSQDVSLSAEDGASFTVKEDSIIVKALERPGAILYFNEFNAMPAPAQMFLHSLFDGKRQVTLKTSSGRIVKAHKDVIICSSMNPGYPGTVDPQFATRSRMIPIKMKYPEFKKADLTFSAAEALRVARSVKSLKDLAINPDMEENEFIKLWDNYINAGVVNNELLTPERKFDLEVIFALLTFGDQIRDGFISFIGKKEKRAFKVSQPFSLREMRRCAYLLSNMSQAEKQNLDSAEGVAKDLIRKVYSAYLFNEKEAEELENKLSQWTAQKTISRL